VFGWSWTRWLLGFTLMAVAGRGLRVSVYLGPAVVWLDKIPPPARARVAEGHHMQRGRKSGGGDK
jgi:hypothetical protein